MLKASIIAVFDVGKTNVKLVVFDSGGQVLWQQSQANMPVSGDPYPHADIGKIWDFLLCALTQAARLHRIDVLVPTCHGATGALVDTQGLVLPVMDYEFEGLRSINWRYSHLRPAFDQTFSPDLPAGLNLGRQLAWQAWHFPDAFLRAKDILTYPQYWAWRLSGVTVSEVTSLGCHTDLWEPVNARPSSLVAALALRLPPLVAPWTRIGVIRREIAAETGLSRDVGVICGIHDSSAALLPYLLMRQTPFTLLSTGTWIVLMCARHGLAHLRAGDDMLANVDANGLPIACARFMGGREYAAIAGNCTTVPTPADIEDLIRDQVSALPAFSPHGGPFARRRGSVSGTLAPSLRSSLASLYCALMCDEILARLGVSVGEIIVDGIFAENAAFCAVLAQLRPDQDVRCAQDPSGTARGAAMLANWPDCAFKVETARVKPWPVQGLAEYRKRWQADIAQSP